MRRASLVGLTLAVAVLAVPVAGAPSDTSPSSPTASVGPYTGVAIGTLDRFRHIQNSQFTSNSTDFYRARFTYSFQVDSFGNVSGVGTGAYLAATWHLDGATDDGAFSCDVPMSTKGFGVRVTGHSTAETITIRFAMEGSGERNDDYDCGANFTGFATESARLADSLDLVQPPAGIAISRADLRIASLSKLEQTGDRSDGRVNLHEWSFTIAAPGAPPPPDPPVGVGSGGSGGQPLTGLVGTVGPGGTISLRMNGRPARILLARPYRILVRDRSATRNFHLSGPGVNRRTQVRRTGTFTWNVTLRAGTYRFVSDPQARRLRGSVIVR